MSDVIVSAPPPRGIHSHRSAPEIPRFVDWLDRNHYKFTEFTITAGHQKGEYKQYLGGSTFTVRQRSERNVEIRFETDTPSVTPNWITKMIAAYEREVGPWLGESQSIEIELVPVYTI